MTVKILSSTSTFNGVSYNTNKTQSAKGELMKFRNFGYLQSAQQVTPAEMKTFLKVHSNRNTRVKHQQFHAMISCKGREYDKKELTGMAEKWLHKMGYGDNPYLIVFHGDTNNNHVHMVSSRIGNDGKKINDSMERIRAQKCILEIMDRNPGKECHKVLDQLKTFSFSTVSQAKLYLETLGYSLNEKEGKLVLYKFGLLQGELTLNELNAKADSYSPDKGRIKQLHALFDKYRKVYSSAPVPIFEPLKGNRLGKPTGYRSEMAEFLKEKFGVELIFHGKDGKAPYGYSIIDHSRKIILKGSEVFPLKNLTREETTDKVRVVNFASQSDKAAYENITGTTDTVFRFKRLPRQAAYRLKLLSVLEEFSNPQKGLEEYRLHLLVNDKRLFLLDTRERYFISLEAILKTDEYNRFARLWNVPERNDTEQGTTIRTASDARDHLPVQADNEILTPNAQDSGYADHERETAPPLSNFKLDIHQDVDDEALHGRRRKKEKGSKKRSIR
ncbi:relaxase/mobilization nuclease domain-containing protein [Pleomorphovibrio marinus]|uniref:relaxase/mobilization nuclease domain-containing protein n=1 Tax=Pleomorphovibrio marinus TaxID=2164132 RepID=UPI000E0A8D98|nr:relaxase/mobilization nuclease domain-containing protein [Pleomorphovibrio marinus]